MVPCGARLPCLGGGENPASGKPVSIDCRGEARALVVSLDKAVKDLDPGFLVLPHDDEQLLTEDGSPEGLLDAEFVSPLDGLGP